MVSKLSSCCCCFDLKTGVLVIGILSLIGGISNLATPFSHGSNACKLYSTNCTEFGTGEASGIIIGNLVGISFTILMMYGSQKGKPGYMLPSVILSIIGLIILEVIVWVAAVVGFKTGATDVAVTVFIVGHLIVALGFYFFMVIYSRYKDLKYGPPPAYPKENYPLYV